MKRKMAGTVTGALAVLLLTAAVAQASHPSYSFSIPMLRGQTGAAYAPDNDVKRQWDGLEAICKNANGNPVDIVSSWDVPALSYRPTAHTQVVKWYFMKANGAIIAADFIAYNNGEYHDELWSSFHC